VVAEGRRIDDDPGIQARLLEPVDHLVFRIGLPAQEFESVTVGDCLAEPLDITQRLASIEMRLPTPRRLRFGPFSTWTRGAAIACSPSSVFMDTGAVRAAQYMLLALINLLVR